MKVDPKQLPMHAKLASRWYGQRTYGPCTTPSNDDLVERKRAEGLRISVAIPALNEEATIGDICATISRALMEDAPLVDELIVLDGRSTDATHARAREAGAQIMDVATILPDLPLVPGKGESLWRSLAALRGDIIVWVDADIRDFAPHFVTRLVAPLLTDPSIDFVKGYYERPIDLGTGLLPTGGGRVTELLARPLLHTLFPELGGIVQPLAGEYAGRADVLRSIPFFTGYSVEVGILIDLLDAVGLDGIAQADLGTRVHRNRPLADLSPMAFQIARTILRRAEERGRIGSLFDAEINPLLRLDGDGTLEATMPIEVERPPIDAPRRITLPETDLLPAAN
jgi:glucosyl-3-phosphoglycerate synthase